MATPQEILEFWFQELTPEMRFAKDTQLDQTIRVLFMPIYEKAREGETASWRSTPEGRLAEIIVLDQFPRNMFRDTAVAFESDTIALMLAQQAVISGDDQKLTPEQKGFLYMPYMHSEDPEIHKKAVVLFSQPGLESNLKYEQLHKKIIDRFGRYPHRNQVLNRKSTAEEVEFLKEENSSF